MCACYTVTCLTWNQTVLFGFDQTNVQSQKDTDYFSTDGRVEFKPATNSTSFLIKSLDDFLIYVKVTLFCTVYILCNRVNFIVSYSWSYMKSKKKTNKHIVILYAWQSVAATTVIANGIHYWWSPFYHYISTKIKRFWAVETIKACTLFSGNSCCVWSLVNMLLSLKQIQWHSAFKHTTETETEFTSNSHSSR